VMDRGEVALKLAVTSLIASVPAMLWAVCLRTGCDEAFMAMAAIVTAGVAVPVAMMWRWED